MMGINHQWLSYILGVEGKPAYIYVDAGLFDHAPLKTHPYLVLVMVHFLDPNEKGLAAKKEELQLKVIEGKLQQEITMANGILVGKSVSNGTGKFYFYFESLGGFDQFKKKIADAFRDYTFDFQSEKDAPWLFYKDKLYPDDWQMQLITNFNLVQNLKKMGDNLEEPRLVEHTLYFSSKSDIKAFSKDAQTKGFKIGEIVIKKANKMPYMLIISKIDKVDFGYINEVVKDIFNLMSKYHADYDGWECEVVY